MEQAAAARARSVTESEMDRAKMWLRSGRADVPAECRDGAFVAAEGACSTTTHFVGGEAPLVCDRTVRCGTDWPSRTGADASRGTDTTQWNGRSVYPDPVDARGACACASRVAARGRDRCRGQTTLSAANDRNSPGR
eukprot:scaffold2434_cov116-Isochrysis_galbana.AAC.6